MDKDYKIEYRIVTNGEYYRIQYKCVHQICTLTDLIINFFNYLFSYSFYLLAKLSPKIKENYNKSKEEEWTNDNQYQNFLTLKEAQNYLEKWSYMEKLNNSKWTVVKE